MTQATFNDEAKRASQLTQEGLSLLIEVNDLQLSLSSLKNKDEAALGLIREIIAKEKMAVGLIQQSTLIQRELMKRQHTAIEVLTKGL